MSSSKEKPKTPPKAGAPNKSSHWGNWFSVAVGAIVSIVSLVRNAQFVYKNELGTNILKGTPGRWSLGSLCVILFLCLLALLGYWKKASFNNSRPEGVMAFLTVGFFAGCWAVMLNGENEIAQSITQDIRIPNVFLTSLGAWVLSIGLWMSYMHENHSAGLGNKYFYLYGLLASFNFLAMASAVRKFDALQFEDNTMSCKDDQYNGTTLCRNIKIGIGISAFSGVLALVAVFFGKYLDTLYKSLAVNFCCLVLWIVAPVYISYGTPDKNPATIFNALWLGTWFSFIVSCSLFGMDMSQLAWKTSLRKDEGAQEHFPKNHYSHWLLWAGLNVNVLVTIKQLRFLQDGGLGNQPRPTVWVMSGLMINIIISFVALCLYHFNFNSMAGYSKLEGILLFVAVGITAAFGPALVNGANNLVHNAEQIIGENNLFWLAGLVILVLNGFLLAAYLTGTRLNAEPRKHKQFKIADWVRVATASFVVMSGTIRKYKTEFDFGDGASVSCADNTRDASTCKALEYGIALGAISGAACAIFVCFGAKISVVVSQVTVFCLVVMWSVGVAFLLFGSKAPALLPSYVWLWTWLAFMFTGTLVSNELEAFLAKKDGNEEPVGKAKQLDKESGDEKEAAVDEELGDTVENEAVVAEEAVQDDGEEEVEA